MSDFLDDYLASFTEIIQESLKKGDVEILMGLQCLDSAVDYSGVQGMESIINVMFTETLNVAEEAKAIRKELATDYTRLYSLGLVDKKKDMASQLEAGYIIIDKIRNACGGLQHHLDQIDWLQQQGFIGGYAQYGCEITHLFLPKPMWEPIIDKIVNAGQETEVFGSAMGKLLSIAYNKRGFGSLKPLILAFNKANKSSGEIATDMFIQECCTAVSRPQRFYSNMIERDNKKNEAIKAILHTEGGVMILNPNGIRAIARWRTLAERRARERTTGE